MIFAEACGNTFLIHELEPDEPIEVICHQAVETLIKKGRDSALLLSRISTDAWKMDVLEKDNSFSNFCGNGSRAVACYLWKKYGLNSVQLINCLSQVCRIEFFPEEGAAAVTIYDVACEDSLYRVLGEPHIIYRAPVDQVARLAALHPGNVNVSSIFPISPHQWKIATWERGVGAITQACGSGCVAAMHSLILSKEEEVDVDVTFLCPGGNNCVHKNLDGGYVLSGPASCCL